ncbi:MAG: TIGR02221 family CRISPR-associated protein [Treponema sp.]|jgi:CRISPR-associated Csx2 family protein|nr:TIGR02221 family CRISPR-associated protein [Treponema sp.]
MSGYTLISCIGTGMYKKEGGYRQTTYRFPNDGEEYKTSLFLEAILRTEYRPIKKVILVGTCTSSWDMLIDDPYNNQDLFYKIHIECGDKEKGISPDSKYKLEAKLRESYSNIPFKIIAHTDKLDQENVEGVFSDYGKISDYLEPNTDILFDISHGFRSMPLLVFQSLQLNAVKMYSRTVELIYGEYIQDEDISYVRDLSKYWDYYEISSAIRLFKEKFDGKLLAKKVKPFWESGSNILDRLSEIVECNYSLQIPEALDQLKDALDNFDNPGKLRWLTDVKGMLAEIFERLRIKQQNEKYPVAKIVWEFSKLLHNRDLITQAVIAKQVAAETAMAEKLDPSKIGDYDWFRSNNPSSLGLKENGYQQLRGIRQNNQKLRILGHLEYLRNQVAHGGKKKENEDYNQEYIKGKLKPIDNAIRELFTVLG